MLLQFVFFPLHTRRDFILFLTRLGLHIAMEIRKLGQQNFGLLVAGGCFRLLHLLLEVFFLLQQCGQPRIFAAGLRCERSVSLCQCLIFGRGLRPFPIAFIVGGLVEGSTFSFCRLVCDSPAHEQRNGHKRDDAG